MSKKNRGDLVYSTGPVSPDPPPNDARPSGITAPAEAVLRLEKKGRGGKTVTVIELRHVTESRAHELSRMLKHTCGVGGTTRGAVIELQGDQRTAARTLMEREGLRVRGG